MAKKLLFALWVLMCTKVLAQAPANYYNNAYNGGVPKTCATLKTALFDIISANTTVLPYTSSTQFDTWDAVNSIDTQRNDDNTRFEIWDMYTDNPTGTDLYSFTLVSDQCGQYSGIGDCYNREHSFPQAWFDQALPMLTDMHHVFGTDGFTNGKHDNFPYGDVSGTPDWVSPSGARLGNSNFAGYTGKVFEPINAYKGDFARAMFYMVTRYQSDMVAWQNNSNANQVLSGNTYPSIDPWAIKQWYRWHLIDPVSEKERIRNNKIFAFQGNRNPFVDHPEFVDLIWSCTNLLSVTLLDFTAAKNANAIVLNWKAAGETGFKEYQVERSTDGRNFSSVGVVAGTGSAQYQFTDVALPNAKNVFYRLKLLDSDGKFTYSKVVNIRLLNANGALLFPNPAQNVAVIKLQQPLATATQLVISDIAGRQVMQQTLPAGQNNYQINLRVLAPGRYFVRLLIGTQLLQESFIKQ
jgi:endonuclease I